MFNSTREVFNVTTKDFLNFKRNKYPGSNKMFIPVFNALGTFKHIDTVVPNLSKEETESETPYDCCITFCTRNTEGTKTLYDMEAYINSLYSDIDKTSIEIDRQKCPHNGKTFRNITIKIKNVSTDIEVTTAVNNWLKCIQFFNDR